MTSTGNLGPLSGTCGLRLYLEVRQAHSAHFNLVGPLGRSRRAVRLRCHRGHIVVLKHPVAAHAEPADKLVPQSAAICVLVQRRTAGEEDHAVLVALIRGGDLLMEVCVRVEGVVALNALETAGRQRWSLVRSKFRHSPVSEDRARPRRIDVDSLGEKRQ